MAKQNPSAIEDPVSLKSETSDKNPTYEEDGASERQSQRSSDPNHVTNLAPTEGDIEQKQGASGKEAKSLKQRAEEGLNKGNATMLGDPVSLKAETSDTEPTEHDRGARGETKRESKI